MSDKLRAWHGSHGWQGRPEIRAPKKGNAECGPGLYLTTGYNTAKKYAKGSGKVLMMELEPNIKWLENEKMDVKVLTDFLKDAYGLRKKKQIIEEILGLSERLRDGETQMPVSYLVNTFVNLDVSHGQNGLILNEWLVEQGIDASLANNRYSEDWLTIFNMDIISKVYTNERDFSSLLYHDFPKISEQLAAIEREERENLERGLR